MTTIKEGNEIARKWQQVGSPRWGILRHTSCGRVIDVR